MGMSWLEHVACMRRWDKHTEF